MALHVQLLINMLEARVTDTVNYCESIFNSPALTPTMETTNTIKTHTHRSMVKVAAQAGDSDRV